MSQVDGQLTVASKLIWFGHSETEGDIFSELLDVNFSDLTRNRMSLSSSI